MKEWSNLAKVVYARTYSRKQEDGTSETWEQTVNRVIDGNVSKYRGTDALENNEEDRLKYFLSNRKAMPAGRGLWISGTETQKQLGASGLTNCYVLSSDAWENFCIAADMLMLGGGVGLSVENKYTSKLPRIKRGVQITNKETNDADFIVPDSRAGWIALIGKILKCYFVTGKSFSYSCVLVRAAGEPIKGFGGKASGKRPLITFVEKLSTLLSSKEGRLLHPIDAADILCMIGEVVVAGNVRRSALLIQGDPYDKEFLKAKRWDLGNVPTYRAMANFSVNCSDVDDLHPAFWKTYEHGEPFGIVNIALANKFGRMGEEKKDAAVAANPCQPADATVITPKGISTIEQTEIGDSIWSETGWTKILNKWSTGIKPVFRYHTTGGHFKGTENHRLVCNGEKIEARYADAIDTLQTEVEVLNINTQDVMDGLMIGDGTKHLASAFKVYLNIGDKDQDYFNSELSELIIGPHAASYGKAFKVTTTITQEELPVLPIRVIPNRFFYGDRNTVAGFLRGLFTANGGLSGNRVALKSSCLELILQAQQMLSLLGIKSYYTTNKPTEITHSNGIYTSKQSYDLNISGDRNKFKELIGFVQPYKNTRLDEICLIPTNKVSKTTYDVVRVEYTGDEEVFDITVDNEPHTYWTGGVNVSNCAEQIMESGGACNLTELFLPNLDTEEEFLEAGRLMYRWAKRVTLEGYHQPLMDGTVKKTHRVGVGITGCLMSKLFNEKSLSKVYQSIREEDVVYSKLLGVGESIRLTTIKPSGSISLLGDVTPGLHPSFSNYYTRRVRFAANDDLIPQLKEAGHFIEPVKRFDGTLDHETLIAEFPCKTAEGTPVADQDWDTWKQLDVIKLAGKSWTDSSASVTVYYKKDEIPKIKEWLQNNLSEIKSISFLCHNDHGFDQAPYEAISEEEYNKQIAKITPLSFDSIRFEEEPLLDDFACAGGACPIR